MDGINLGAQPTPASTHSTTISVIYFKFIQRHPTMFENQLTEKTSSHQAASPYLREAKKEV
jgi:hypothetical protein